MPPKSYKFVYDEYGNTKEIRVHTRGIGVQGNNYVNKGTAFNETERRDLGMEGGFPPAVRPLEQQIKNSLEKIFKKEDDIERYIYMRSLFDRNVTLAHRVIASDIRRFMEIIYTPTVGLACQQFSSLFRSANGVHIFPGNIDRAEEILRRYGHRDIRVAVVTDNQGILGLGDQGAGGIAICLGKLMLYTQGAGIAPWHCLPISLDVGTNNQALLDNDEYLGWRHLRLTGSEYVKFVQQFARAFKNVFPHALCQWEDFSKQNAFAVRDAYLHDLISFNDDIQGTGAVTLAAIFAAMKIKGEKIEDQVYLVHGAGAGGVGIAEQIEVALLEHGLKENEARRRIFTLDSKGVITSDRMVEPYKAKYAKNPVEMNWLQDSGNNALLDTIKHAGVTVLIGTSGQPGCFTREVVKAMAANNVRPVILPLSNPTDKAEALPQDIYKWTGGKALVATGSPFPKVKQDGREIRVGQCNNVFIFPGVGLGTLASGAKEVLPSFFTAGAKAVAELVSQEDLEAGILMPRVEKLKDVSSVVALAVGLAAIRGGVSTPCAFSKFKHKDDPKRLKILLEKMHWVPEYLPLVPV
ncbi:MAG: oxaloacetate-decarboxylating malate dehydrogenase [Desulfobacterales bacterium]|nr:oxaloacetate-decarboxylating malate dehydrogenase [Desulfobacterales bacterium]